MPPSPRQVAETAFQAVASHDWDAFLALVDPSAIQQFKERELGMLELLNGAREAWEESSMGEGESAPYFERTGGRLQDVFAVADASALRALPAVLVLRRWLRVATGLRSPSEGSARVILGEVPDGADRVHVVFREHLEFAAWRDDAPAPPAVDRVRLITVHRTSRGWRVGLGGGLVVDESGGSSIGYNAGEVDPTEGEAHFLEGYR